MQTGDPHQLALAVESVILTCFGKTTGHHNQAPHAGQAALAHHLQHGCGGDGDQGQVNEAGHLADPCIGPHSLELVHLGVDDGHPTGEAGVEDVLERLCPDRIRVTACTDDGDRGRFQQRSQTHRLGSVLPRLQHGLRPVGGIDVEGQRDHLVVRVMGDLIAGVAEDGHDLLVLGQDFRDEPVDAPLTRGSREMLEQHRPQTPALVGVGDAEGDFRLLLVDAVVASDADDLAADQCDDRHPGDVVDMGELL